MQKFTKKIKFLVFLLPILALGYLVFLFYTRPTLITPWPYLFTKYTPENVKEAEEADILLVGDANARDLENTLVRVGEELEPKIGQKLKIFNWAIKGEGLHRTLYKLSLLSHYPDIVIFSGGGPNPKEQLFRPEDFELVMKNFEIFRHEIWGGLIQAYPPFSRFIYHGVQPMIIKDKPLPPLKVKDDALVLKVQELSYQLFSSQLQSLMILSKAKNFSLITLSAPLNLDLPPGKSCDQAHTKEIVLLVNKVAKLIRKNEMKEALKLALEINTSVSANAHALYALGKAYAFNGQYTPAKKYLDMALIYDCAPFRSNSVYNKMIKNTSLDHGATFIDFDELVNSYYGKNILFLDEEHPQAIFYQVLGDTLKAELKNLLELSF